MIKDIILLSGPVACGKSTLASELESRYRITRLKTRSLIMRLAPNVRDERLALQAAGDRLDRQTRGEWIATELQKMIGDLEPGRMILVDAVRIPRQVEAIRRAFHPRVLHIHLTASAKELDSRYRARAGTASEDQVPLYEAVRKNKTEKNIENLANDADVVIDTDRCRAQDVLVRAASHLGFFGRTYERLVDVLIGGGYGSEGKGQVVSYLAHEYDYLVRVGGPNAGHKVWMDGGPYSFHILPSGAFHSQAKLIIGPGAVISVPKIMKEIADVDADTERLFIDPQAMIIEPEDVAWEEKHLVGSIGSTGQGVGHATARRILNRRTNAVRLAGQVPELKGYTRRPVREVLDAAFFEGKRVLLEGTQGTGLSLYHGEYPYVTSRDSSVGGCLAEAGIAPSRVRKIILVVRTYPIRVQSPEGGYSGDMGTEISWDAIAERAELDVDTLRATERTTTTNRERRVAEFNWELLRIAASLNAPTDIALTFADYIHKKNKNAHRYEQLTTTTVRLVEEIERVAAAPVSLISTGFGRRVIIDRRTW